jgi:hypothetical protein
LLTITQIKIIRAALQYFLEELGPHGDDALAGYLDAGTAKLTDVTETRDLVASCRIGWIREIPGSTEFGDDAVLTPVPEEIRQMATILCLP